MMKNLSFQRLKDFQKLLKNAQLDGYICMSTLELRYFSGVDVDAEEAVFLLTPRKSVTAVIGITDIPYSPEKAPVRCGHKCAACGNAGCAFRKTE